MIISPDLVIYAILISVKAVQLSLMFLFAVYTLSPSIISHTSFSAGAAAAAREALKDKHHKNNVLAAEGVLYPLIVETFTPFAIETVKNIVAMDCRPRGLSGIQSSNSPYVFGDTMLRLSSAT